MVEPRPLPVLYVRSRRAVRAIPQASAAACFGSRSAPAAAFASVRKPFAVIASATLDFESDVETILRVGERHAMQLRDRQGDAQRIDDEDEPARELPLEAGGAHSGVDAEASRGRPVERHQA